MCIEKRNFEIQNMYKIYSRKTIKCHIRCLSNRTYFLLAQTDLLIFFLTSPKNGIKILFSKIPISYNTRYEISNYFCYDWCPLKGVVGTVSRFCRLLNGTMLQKFAAVWILICLRVKKFHIIVSADGAYPELPQRYIPLTRARTFTRQSKIKFQTL